MSTLNAFFGQYGGQYVPAELIPALNQLETQFCKAQQDQSFRKELNYLLCDYARPSDSVDTLSKFDTGDKDKNLPQTRGFAARWCP